MKRVKKCYILVEKYESMVIMTIKLKTWMIMIG